MSCNRYRQLISRYVDDEVTPRQRSELLAHVQVCRDCAAWLARARQTDVLLKGVNDAGPSDRVRNAILSEVRAHRSKAPEVAYSVQRRPTKRSGAFRMVASGLLLRFDLSPARIVLGLAAAFVAVLGLAYSLNLLPPIMGYNKLGFEYQPDSNSAHVDTTPIPMNAVTSGRGGVGGPVAVPNLVRILPVDSAQQVALDTPLRVRFDQPMDRGSVESALRVDPPAAGIYSWDADNEVRFTPAAPGLLRGITYTVTLTGTALSMAGTPVHESARWSFRTVAAHAVTAEVSDGSSVAPTSTFSLQFDAPMSRSGIDNAVSLRDAATNVVLPSRYSWDGEGKVLTVAPVSALREGYAYLRVQSDARTEGGESLGQGYEFKYRVEATRAVVRLPGSPFIAAPVGGAISVPYETSGASPALVDGLLFDIYGLPAERLSDMGGAPQVAGALPAGFPDVLQRVKQLQPAPLERKGSLDVSDLAAGIYLVVAGKPGGEVSDWTLLVIGDSQVALTARNGPLWATDAAGRAWQGAEVSLYSQAGALLEKGLTEASGLWLPSGTAKGAVLAIARDLSGHVAAARVGEEISWGETPEKSLPATFVTDLPGYTPGGTISFRLLLEDGADGVLATPVAEQDVSLSLLMPGGATVETLRLRPDSVGGISGLFVLSRDAAPGVYTVRVVAGSEKHDFPLDVLAGNADSLSVFIVPGDETQVSEVAITRTVSVLGAAGLPAVGSIVTATLGIPGEEWASEAITGTTDVDGRVQLVAPMPAWLAQYNEPGLFLYVEAEQDGAHGSDRAAVDLTSLHSALLGTTQLVSPGLNVALVARSAPDAPFKVRVVLLDQTSPEGDVLLQAESPTGERLSYSLDMARLLDATVNIPQQFAGGSLSVMSAGKAGIRMLSLLPAQGPDVNLRVITPYTITAGAEIPLRLLLTNADGSGTAGTASIWLRRVAGGGAPNAQTWEPSLQLPPEGVFTTTLQAPNSAGLWYVMAEAATAAGSRTVSWGVVRVLPGPWVQLPPRIAAVAGEPKTTSMVVHNPTGETLSSGLRVVQDGSASVDGPQTQTVEVPAGGWQRLDWGVTTSRPGAGQLLFSFISGSGTGGRWPVYIEGAANPRTHTTYTAGVLTGERTVGVAVPSGLSSGNVQLEIRASTSLLPSLAGIVSDLPDIAVGQSEGVSLAAARLSSPASVGTAYAHLNASVPASLQLSGVEQSILLQQIYSAQHTDGSWGYTLDGTGEGSVRITAEVLLALQRVKGYGSQVAPDAAVISRGLSYIGDEIDRPIRSGASSEALDERAYGLYVMSVYGRASGESARPMMAYAASGLGEHGLSQDGEARLALALWQVGNGADAVELLDRLLDSGAGSTVTASAPMLDALVVGLQSLPAGGVRSRDLPDYAALARSYARALMDARQGAGWNTPSMTADALWALSRYTSVESEPSRLQSGTPALTLGDRTVQTGSTGNSGLVSVLLSGEELKPGTNWLKLKAPDPNQALYYSLTLIATR